MASSSLSEHPSKSKPDRTCKVCETSIAHRSYQARYCEDCVIQIRRDKNRASKRAWRAQNPEESRSRAKKYQERNKDKVKARRKLYRQENKKKIYLKNKAYRKANPEKVRRANRERDRKFGRGYRKTETVRRLIERDGLICGICRNPLLGDPFNGKLIHIDHKVPLANGGTHHFSNLQLAHGVCNSSKAIVLVNQ